MKAGIGTPSALAWVAELFSAPFVWQVVGLLILGAILAVAHIAENTLLAKLIQTTNTPAQPIEILPVVGPIAFSALLCALAFLLARLTIGLFTLAQELLLVRLQGKTRNAIEAQILAGAFQKSEEFFLHHPLAEFINRLGADVSRASMIRHDKCRVLLSVLVVSGNLLYFATQDVLLSVLIGGSAVFIATWVYQHFLPIADLDRSYLKHDDCAKKAFAELLALRKEIKVAHVFGKCYQQFASKLNDRYESQFAIGALRAR